MLPQAIKRLSVAPGGLVAKRAFGTPHSVRLAQKPTVGMFGVPFSGGQPKGGVDLAPDLIRKYGVRQAIEELGWHCSDQGDITLPPAPASVDVFDRVRNPKWVGEVSRLVYEKTKEQASKGHFPLVLGGDHSIAVGTVSGVAAVYPNVGVLWIDAHADINTSGSTPSGNLHGMPLSFLLGLTRPVPGFEWLDMGNPVLARDQLVYIGLRDLENREKEFLRQHSIKSFSMHDVDRLGIGKVMEMAMKIFGDRPLHLSFDIDALDPVEAPSTGTPVRGGLTFREGAFITEFVHDTNRLVSMDLVEINPKLGSEEDVRLTVASGISMIRGALGESLT